MNFTYYGHACFGLEVNGKKLLFDPFITYNDLAKDIDINTIEADYILISHGHEDHVADAPAIALRTQATVICVPEIQAWLARQGVEKVHPMNFGNKTFDFGKLHFVQAMHSSGLPDGSYGGNPGGFIINSDEGNVYYSGDTSLFIDMQLFPKLAHIDTAILPIGGNFTMDATEALMANDMLNAKNVIGVHFDTFGYIKIDHNATIDVFSQANVNFLLPTIGATYKI